VHMIVPGGGPSARRTPRAAASNRLQNGIVPTANLVAITQTRTNLRNEMLGFALASFRALFSSGRRLRAIARYEPVIPSRSARAMTERNAPGISATTEHRFT
jgi:hypothetical protein